MWLHRRLEINIPNIWWERLFSKEWYKELFWVQAGHGGDEYGNCSLYFSCAYISIVVFPNLCFQRKVELPGPGEHPFTDALYWNQDLAYDIWYREYVGIWPRPHSTED